jgi:hypothetical protein
MKPLLWVAVSCGVLLGQAPLDILNHNRPILDAHNCYPYSGQWVDRLDRALSTGTPVAIEQDLAWAIDPKTGKGQPVVSHSRETTGTEPTLRDYFFEHVRPTVEKALRENNRSSWPLITVHFDFKDNRPELHRAIWELLGEYEPWIATAVKGDDPRKLAPIEMKPLLVLTEDNDAQEQVFFISLKTGDKLRLFGSAHTVTPKSTSREELAHLAATLPPEALLTEKPTNYRRWWNNSWAEVEEGGQAKSGEWTFADNARLRALVDHAHKQGFWIRFYTIDGFGPGEDKGWGQGYNFGSRAAALVRWQAAIAAGVNLIATDQFEDLAATMRATK